MGVIVTPFEPRSEFGIWGSTPYAKRRWFRVLAMIALSQELARHAL